MSVLPHAFGDYDAIGDTAALFAARLRDQEDAAYYHVMLAWNGVDAGAINSHLAQARAILHEVTVAAVQLGYTDLAAHALHVETQILAHLNGDYTDLAICPGGIVQAIESFSETCEELTCA